MDGKWQYTIQASMTAIVAVHFRRPLPFDTEQHGSGQATGFVVDAERGFILTNRHVVGPGPFSGWCVFGNHEQCDVQPLYHDPVHDFAFLKFDPTAIKYLDMTSLKLCPDDAQLGAEVRIIGNDAGEELTVLSGVISRLDRNAPDYGSDYNDFNTNYIQAAAAATSGSSGSPVINVAGVAVALQAGGRTGEATTDFFLPLDRPLRALQCLQNGDLIRRGTIQVQWKLMPFDECRRLGLTPWWESAFRETPGVTTNMLVADVVLPEGPADGKVQQGDILLKVNGVATTSFMKLDEILDSKVGSQLYLLVLRGGLDIEVTVTIQDLHTISPDRLVIASSGIFHNLSYQKARLHAIACKGLYVRAAGATWDGMDDSIIDSVNQKPTPDLDAFIQVMREIPDKSRVAVSYRRLESLSTIETKIIWINRHWQGNMRLAKRNDETGSWDFENIAGHVAAIAPKPQTAGFIESDGHPATRKILTSVIEISCAMLIKIDGFPECTTQGFALVVDRELGFAIVSRAIVPHGFCDIIVTIAGSIQVEGEVVFLHPLDNYAVIKYDPQLVHAPVESAPLSDVSVQQGAETLFVGFADQQRLIVAKTMISEFTTVSIPATPHEPRYRSIYLDVIAPDSKVASQFSAGVFINLNGMVEALWMNHIGERRQEEDVTYNMGIPTPRIKRVIDKIRRGTNPRLNIVTIEPMFKSLSFCRDMGVTEYWLQRVTQAGSCMRQLFMVSKAGCNNTHGRSPFEGGDIILTLNNQLVTRASDFDVMYSEPTLDALVVRKGHELRFTAPTFSAATLETRHALEFLGAVLQTPHFAVQLQIDKLHSGIYINHCRPGSPAAQYGLQPNRFITHVNEIHTNDLESFAIMVNKISVNTYFRLRVVTLENIPGIITIKKAKEDDDYFATVQFSMEGSYKLKVADRE